MKTLFACILTACVCILTAIFLLPYGCTKTDPPAVTESVDSAKIIDSLRNACNCNNKPIHRHTSRKSKFTIDTTGLTVTAAAQSHEKREIDDEANEADSATQIGHTKKTAQAAQTDTATISVKKTEVTVQKAVDTTKAKSTNLFEKIKGIFKKL